MPQALPTLLRCALAAAAAAALAGCGSMNNVGGRLADAVTPYRIEVVQGNFVSREQVEALRPGMTRQQVREILGTPLLTSLFHEDRWDYVFTIKRQGVESQRRHLVVNFKGDELQNFTGDTMPSEAEFVTTLDKRVRRGRVPVLEATEDQLNKFGRPAAAAPAQPAAAAPATPTTYPPLEPAAR